MALATLARVVARTIFLALVGAWTVLACAADLTCGEATDSVVACQFTIVTLVAADPVLPTYQPIERIVVKGGTTTTVADSYLGKTFCPDWVPAFGPVPAPPTGTYTCMLAATIGATNTLPTLKPSAKPFMPVSTTAASVKSCELISDEFANKPYDYVKDSPLVFWIIHGEKNSFTNNSQYLSDQEADLLARVCQGKWYINGPKDTTIPISDFAPPTFLNHQAALVNLGQEIKKQEAREVLKQQLLSANAHLQINAKSHWYAAYEELYYEVKVTQGPDENGPPFAVDNLRLTWVRNTFSGIETCPNTSICAHSERVYATGIAAPSDICAVGVATKSGIDFIVVVPKDKGCTVHH